MPSRVARAMVRAGSRTSPAGTVATPCPRDANIVSGASAARGLDKRVAARVELAEARAIDKEQSIKVIAAERNQLGVGRHLGEQPDDLDASQIDQHHRPDRTEGQRRGDRPAVQSRETGPSPRRQTPPRSPAARPRSRSNSPRRSGSPRSRRKPGGCTRRATSGWRRVAKVLRIPGQRRLRRSPSPSKPGSRGCRRAQAP